MKTAHFDYELPERLVAQYPSVCRGGSRMLVVHRESGLIEDRMFDALPEYIHEGDLVVFNDSKVVKARLLGRKQGTGAAIELFPLDIFSGFGAKSGGAGDSAVPAPFPDDAKSVGAGDSAVPAPFADEAQSGCLICECLAKPARRLRPGDTVFFGAEEESVMGVIAADGEGEGELSPGGDERTAQAFATGSPGLSAKIISKEKSGSVLVRFEFEGDFHEVLDRLGHMPLPPYIKRPDEAVDETRYSTVYATAPGSVAAPTAGLHFTGDMLDRIRAKGAQTAFVTLHVGLGTFLPVKVDDIEAHSMHEEHYCIDEKTAALINGAKEEGRRIICVGTTSLRTIEGAAAEEGEEQGHIRAGTGSTSIFFHPGSKAFRLTDALLTNFHLPRSTLLMLVSAFYDTEKVKAVYRHAVEKEYRFFSYGDAMLIL